jgi:transcriptional regulator, XRE family
LNLEELAKLTGISKSALGNYENNDYKEINHGDLVTLHSFIMFLSTIYFALRKIKITQLDLTNLHLSDDIIDLLRSGSINNRLLCEIATHDKFKELMAIQRFLLTVLLLSDLTTFIWSMKRRLFKKSPIIKNSGIEKRK